MSDSVCTSLYFNQISVKKERKWDSFGLPTGMGPPAYTQQSRYYTSWGYTYQKVRTLQNLSSRSLTPTHSSFEFHATPTFPGRPLMLFGNSPIRPWLVWDSIPLVGMGWARRSQSHVHEWKYEQWWNLQYKNSLYTLHRKPTERIKRRWLWSSKRNCKLAVTTKSWETNTDIMAYNHCNLN